MKSEKRIIFASMLTGISEILLGLIMFITGWHEWYYEHFHFFGVLGIGMLFYGCWHYYLFKRDKK